MGYYIKCEYCGQEEKYTHPNCGCVEKHQNFIIQKTTNAKVVSSLTMNKGPFTFLYTQYEKNGTVFWVRQLLRSLYGYSLSETITEVDLEEVEETDNQW